MNTSALSEGVTAAYSPRRYLTVSRYGDPTSRLSVSQSFGKSFPDIGEDSEDVPDGREEEGGSTRPASFTGPRLDQSLAPAKARRPW